MDNSILVFISHSLQNKELANRFNTYFAKAFRLTSRQVFNVSNQSIRAANDFRQSILSAIRDAKILLFIVSEEFLSSTFCLCEMGAAWAFGKKPYIFLVEPVEFSDKRIINLPFSGLQSLAVSHHNEDNISAFIDDMTEYLSSFSTPVNDLLLTEIKNEFLQYLSSLEQPVPEIVCSDGILFHNPEGISTDTLKCVHNVGNCIRLVADFTMQQPNFVGYAIRLHHDDWSSCVEAGYALSLTFRATTTLKVCFLELKSDPNNRPIQRVSIPISNEQQTVIYPLKNFSSRLSDWKQMSELVFVFNRDSIDSVACLEISDIKLVQTDSPST